MSLALIRQFFFSASNMNIAENKDAVADSANKKCHGIRFLACNVT